MMPHRKSTIYIDGNWPDCRFYIFSASLNVVVLPRNSEVSVMCGCRGNFTWELIPTDYCHFYLFPHLVNTVDHTVGTCKPLSTFTEALWEGYNICIRHIMSTDKLTDYCLAVYQQHHSSCYRNLTRYTIKSVKNILLFIEKFKISGVSSAFCSCPPHTAKTDSPIFCFTCIQLHCEVKSMFLDNIDNNFSYQNQANGNFTLNAFPSGYFYYPHLVSQKNDLLQSLGPGEIKPTQSSVVLRESFSLPYL